MKTLLVVKLFSLILLINVKSSLACNGYKLKFNKIANCNADNVIAIDKNFTVTLNKNCEVMTEGCLTSKGFTQAKVKYVISKNGMPIMTGEPDICSELDKKDQEAIGKLELIGFPTHCPIPEGRRCVDAAKKIDVTKYKKYLNLARGKVDVKADIEHDTGTSCIKIEFEVYK